MNRYEKDWAAVPDKSRPPIFGLIHFAVQMATVVMASAGAMAAIIILLGAMLGLL